MACSSKKQKNYHFHSEWETDYFFILVKDKCVCLLCYASISVRKWNVERHFKTNHAGIEKDFPLNSALRKEEVSQLKSKFNDQQETLRKRLNQNRAVTEASFRVSNIIAQNKKPYEDGEIIKSAFLEAADALFDSFQNKTQIMSAIKSVQLSANTVMRRVEDMSSDVISQLKTDFNRCSYFSLQIDESTDIVDTAQLAVFSRMVFNNFEIREELVKVVPLTGRTTGQDIFVAVKNLINSENIPLNKLVGLATDGAPAMIGREKGFISLCRKDNTFPKFLSYHCVIHQESLCGKFLSMNNIMKIVIEIVNKIRAHALQRRLFRALTDEVDCQYGELLLHTEVRWLSRGRVLRRFQELLPALVKFLKERNESFPELEDPCWMQDLAFLVDITEKLNILNLHLQGKDKDIVGTISDIASFSKKLELWEKNIIQGEYKHFTCLKQTLEEQGSSKTSNTMSNNRKQHAEIISELRREFNKRFEDFRKISIVAQFVKSPLIEIDPEEFSTCVIKHFDFQEDIAAVELELIDFQNDLSLKSLSSSSENIWPLVPKEKYPILVQVCLKVKAMFSSTYLCETSFSSMKFIKNKYRNRLTDEHLDNCIRMAITTYTPAIEKLIDGKQQLHPSH